MKIADIKLGYECNNKCIHCVIQNQKERAKKSRGKFVRSTEECKEEILASYKSGCEAVVVTGGEPTIRKDFELILRYIKSLGMFVTVQTNGRKFSDKNFTKNSSKFIDLCVVALHAADKHIHNYITQTDNSFEETVGGIKNLVSYDINVFGKIVVSKFNFKSLIDIIKLFENLGVKDVNIAFPHACENLLPQYEDIVPTYSEIRNHIEECLDYCRKNRINLELETILPCALSSNYSVKHFVDLKEMQPCIELKQMDSDTLLWNELRKKNKRKLTICGLCEYNEICDGYWMEYINFYGENEFKHKG